MRWEEQVVSRLGELKAADVEFDAAWERALREFPPRARDMGPERPSLFDQDETGTVVGFFRKACREAWAGDRPSLAHFDRESLLLPNRESHPPVHRSRAAHRARPAVPQES